MPLMFSSGASTFLSVIEETPVCVVKSNLMLLKGKTPQLIIPLLKDVIIGMASHVEVSRESRLISIFSNKNEPLVKYSDSDDYSTFFFDAWLLKNALIFEYQIYHIEFIFSLFGIWKSGSWEQLSISNNQRLEIFKPPVYGG